MPWLLLRSAERRLSSSLSVLLIAAVPLVGALLVGIAGVAALVGLDLHVSDALALVEIVGVFIGYAVGPFLLARYLSDLPGLGVTATALAITAIGRHLGRLRAGTRRLGAGHPVGPRRGRGRRRRSGRGTGAEHRFLNRRPTGVDLAPFRQASRRRGGFLSCRRSGYTHVLPTKSTM